MISGATAAVGGIILAAFVNSVALTFPPSTLLLNSIAAAVIGGVSLFGGRGDVRGALLGSLLISTVANGLNTAGYSNGTIYIVTGLILLAAVTLDTVARRLQAAPAARRRALERELRDCLAQRPSGRLDRRASRSPRRGQRCPGALPVRRRTAR